MKYYSKLNTRVAYSPGESLTEIANKFQMDKGDADKTKLSWGESSPDHFTLGYTNTYEKYMKTSRTLPTKLLEIGICDPRFPFASIAMWNSYFSDLNLYCVDNFWGNQQNQEEKINNAISLGANLFVADQSSPDDWQIIESIVGNNTLDFLVEDGSHYPHHMLYSLWRSRNLLKIGAYYFMEDIQDPETTTNFYGYNNISVYESILNFKNSGIFSSTLLNEMQCLEITKMFRFIELHTGGPEHRKTLMAVLQRVS